MTVILSPNHRYANIGKTRTGKTTATAALSSILVPLHDPNWEAWWLDSKRDVNDQAMLRSWGYGTEATARKLHILTGSPDEVKRQAQVLCLQALERQNVLIIIDEYKHVTDSPRRAGEGIEGVFLRGGGLNVGIIGNTQEPVDVPRQLLSQPTHVFLYDLSFNRDIMYMRDFDRDYHRSRCDRQHKLREACNGRRGERYAHALRYCNVDGDAVWRDFDHYKAFHDTVTGSTTGNQPSSQQKVSA